jgi:membrane-associated protein
VFSYIEGWLREHLYAVVFLGAVVDALGIPFPGRMMLITVGSVSGPPPGGSGTASLVILLAVIGTVAGDHVWYLLGRFKGRRLFALYCRIVRLPAVRIATADRLIRRFGGLTLVLGRFAAALRIVVTPLAVSRGMSYRQFLLWDLTGAVLWVAGFVWLGRAAGALGAGAQIGWTLAVLGGLAIASVAMSVMTRRWLARRASVSRA